MVILRKVDPSKVHSVWNAIAQIKYSQKLATEPEKVIKDLVKNEGSTVTEWEECVKNLLSDNLLGSSSRRDMKTQILIFPTETKFVSDKRDWYCFECHKAGDVKFCTTNDCHRVFHKDCVSKACKNIFMIFYEFITNRGSTIFLKTGKLNTIKSVSLNSGNSNEQADSYDENKCLVCNFERVDSFLIDKSEFNNSIKNIHMRSKAWIPNKIIERMTGAEPYPDWVTVTDLESRAKLLLFRLTDMPSIEDNIEKNHYSNFSEYLSDFFTVRHNIGIFHGGESQEYEATEFALRDVFHDLGEIVSCIDCFKHSSETIISEWFSLPCKKPHELVWAKQKGFCYWPAKVIKNSASIYDVRFFGGKHLRAVVNYDNIKPTTESKKNLQLKYTSSLYKAIDEMELLLKFMKNPAELEYYIKTKIEEKNKKTATPNVSSSGGSNSKPLKRMKRLTALPANKKGRLSKKKTLETDVKDKPKSKINVEFKKPVSIPSNPDVSLHKSTSSSESVVPMKKRSLTRGIMDIKVLNEEPINIADDDDNTYTFSGSLTKSAMEFNDNLEDQEMEQVTSSTEGEGIENSKHTQELPKLNQSHNEEVEMMRRALIGLTKKEDMIRASVHFMQSLTEKHNEQLKKLAEAHKAEISEIKRKQWCFFCEQDAIYHCCWNTAYCSVQCQKQHWQQEHKQVCRRKR